MKFFKSLFASANLFTLNSASAKAFTEGWPQIKIYYEILAKSFYASEKGNLDVIKSNSRILVEKAEELSIEGMPAEYRNPKILETLLTLKKQTKLVDFLVQQNIDDNEVRLTLTKLNEVFHSIVELCLNDK
ncbi:hypothetical protein [Flavobacterium wongokense]|uniref:hypothetical protein n=1 Tax=Flavobacterium wongokense TaxID=2910674 RepID=UPI001F311824|nr:hypothetical protein [Flavobacterium sp. WG47]MCF6132584.1 hypothetical protein [Flavobacterium sp. WG47]